MINTFMRLLIVSLTIDDPNFIHPCIVENPINKSNISPYGYMRAVITKPEYDYLIKHGIHVNVFDYVAVKHMNVYPYKEIVETLFNKRLETQRHKSEFVTNV